MSTQAMIPAPIEKLPLQPKPARRDLINALVERRVRQLTSARAKQIEEHAKKGEALSGRLAALVRKHVRQLKPGIQLGWSNGHSFSGAEVEFRMSADLIRKLDADLAHDLNMHSRVKIDWMGISDKDLRERVRGEILQSLGDTASAEARVEKILADARAVSALDELLARIY